MTKPFLDIFSRKPLKIKKEIPKQKIIVDNREKNSLVPAALMKVGFEIEFEQLKVGDYIVKDVVIERKTVTDLHGSIINKRLFNQIEELKQYENKLLIIEGLEHQDIYNDNKGISSNAIRGFLLSITLKHKIPIIFSNTPFDTAKYIEVLSKKKSKELPLNVTKKSFNKKEQLQFIIESFPNIGPKNAKKLLEELKTLQNIFNSSQEELEKIIGKKAEIFNLVKEKY